MRDYEECRTYIDYLANEHRRVNEMLRRAQQMFPNWEEVDVGPWVQRIVHQWWKIRDEIANHFRSEEEGGCLEEAVSRCPCLAQEVAEVMAQHPFLLAKLDSLIHRAARQATPTADWALAIEFQFRKVARDIRDHEERENRIIQQGFSFSLNDDSDVMADAL